MIKDFYFIYGLKADLAKTSYGWSPFSLHLHMDDCHLSCTIKILKKKHSSADRENGKIVTDEKNAKEIHLEGYVSLLDDKWCQRQQNHGC